MPDPYVGPDVISALRRKNLFTDGSIPVQTNPQSSMSPSIQQDSGGGLESDTIRQLRALQSMYQPETEATQRFSDLIANMPQRERPSLGRTLVASGIGLKSGAKAASEVMNEPHARAMTDWNAQMGPAQQAASLERQDNTNERALMGNLLTAKTWEDRLDAQETIASRRAEISRISALAAQARAARWTVEIDGPNVLAISPDGKEVRRIGDASGLTEEDAINLRGEWGVKAAEAAGTGIYTDAQGNTIRIPTRTPGAPAESVEGAQGPLTRPGTSAGKIQGADPLALAKIRQSAQGTLETVDMILDRNGNLRAEIKPVVGGSRWGGGLKRYIPGMPEVAAQDKINNLKARQIINLIEEMKAQSRTGATGFGQLTGRELDVLEAAASRLNAATDEETFTREMRLIKEKLLKILQPGIGEPNDTAEFQIDTNWTPLQRRAAEFLNKEGEDVTPANIDEVIRQGVVR